MYSKDKTNLNSFLNLNLFIPTYNLLIKFNHLFISCINIQKINIVFRYILAKRKK